MTRKDDGSVHLYGYKDDVIEEREKINQLIISHCEETNKNFKMITKTPARNIQWEYNTNSLWMPFSLFINAVIEDAYENKKRTVKFNCIKNKIYLKYSFMQNKLFLKVSFQDENGDCVSVYFDTSRYKTETDGYDIRRNELTICKYFRIYR